MMYYMAHPLGNGYDRIQNIARARRWFNYLLQAHPEHGFTAPWLLYAEMLNESDSNRDRGMRDDLDCLRRCDGIVLVGGRMSPGMVEELVEAVEHKKKVLDYIHLGSEPGVYQ